MYNNNNTLLNDVTQKCVNKYVIIIANVINKGPTLTKTNYNTRKSIFLLNTLSTRTAETNPYLLCFSLITYA